MTQIVGQTGNEVAAMVEQTVSTFGQLDVAFNNAGVMVPAVETADASDEDFSRVTAVNLSGVWNCMKYELRQMREQESGAIERPGRNVDAGG
jgi:NAD(P)-dependent dehydrogenase (short-subunit alcohol dehydrogenase family)